MPAIPNVKNNKAHLPEWYVHFAINQKNILPTFELVHKMRDELSQQNYESTLIKFLALNEGFKDHPYLDTRGNWHIGYGLLMRNANSNTYEKLIIDAFQHALGKDIAKLIPINNLTVATARNFKLTKAECDKLLIFVLQANEAKILKLIPDFKKLPLNIQISIHSLYYNVPALLGPNFMRNLKQYLQNKDASALINCIWEIEHNSNPKPSSDWSGLQNRRYYEGAMFSNKILDVVVRIGDDNLMQFMSAPENAVLSKLLRVSAANNDQIKQMVYAEYIKNNTQNLALFPKIRTIIKFLGHAIKKISVA